MAENRNFLFTLSLVTVAGVLIGLMAFGFSGKGGPPAGASTAAGPVPNAPAPSAADTASEPTSSADPEPVAIAPGDGHSSASPGPALEPYNPNQPPAAAPSGPPVDYSANPDVVPQ